MNFKKLKYILPIILLVLAVVMFKTYKTSCTAVPTPAVLSNPNIDGTTANLSWTSGPNNQAAYINISTSNSVNSDGTLSNASIANDAVTDLTSYSKTSLKAGTYYWNVVTDSCNQRKVSNLSSFTIQSNAQADCQLTPPVLNPPVIKDQEITFSWTNSSNTEAAYINISSSNTVNDQGVLEKQDIANDIVTGKTSYTKEDLPAGTYYWNIINDGCGQRKISELGSFTVQ